MFGSLEIPMVLLLHFLKFWSSISSSIAVRNNLSSIKSPCSIMYNEACKDLHFCFQGTSATITTFNLRFSRHLMSRYHVYLNKIWNICNHVIIYFWTTGCKYFFRSRNIRISISYNTNALNQMKLMINLNVLGRFRMIQKYKELDRVQQLIEQTIRLNFTFLLE